MTPILLGLGLVLVIEGLAWALAPSLVLRMLETLRDMPPEQRRLAGLVALALGVALLWMARLTTL
ncbi:MAG: DUF2065 domain-containing protein [Limimaricola soesokkakensis]|uniref:DUF2065 domain-containing protein n=1 Tax=Limimaricola soesokkakensis TaxID=1343159 RepID=A0A1X6Y8L6_9RHOB|nr:DUF2065 domain-containing protein [Limimaricola soesokkakensis]MCZ4260409.1 DUF2065 domain-containing protein [Limimaricola sp. G21655-S1]PSK87250.1 hypothetical protein CLV79_103301 [Limimaricola soesokkakensis]SLN13533.1 hypothetical protein LOS8367_00097 [Limimaricola soesokkakensis]